MSATTRHAEYFMNTTTFRNSVPHVIQKPHTIRMVQNGKTLFELPVGKHQLRWQRCNMALVYVQILSRTSEYHCNLHDQI
jgi:hypothetical protein